MKLDDLFDHITHDTRFKVRWHAFEIEGTAYGNLHLVSAGENTAFLVMHPHLAGVRDMVSSWFNCLVYSHLNRDKYPGHDLYFAVRDLIHDCCDYSRMYPVEVYDIMKVWSSLVIASILRDMEGNDTFYRAIRDSTPHNGHNLIKNMTKKILTPSDAHIGLELSGLGKIFGHPIIDMESSISSWLEKGSVLKPHKGGMGKRCSQMFKLILCRRYYKE